jgi:hypothetical protein
MDLHHINTSNLSSLEKYIDKLIQFVEFQKLAIDKYLIWASPKVLIASTLVSEHRR